MRHDFPCPRPEKRLRMSTTVLSYTRNRTRKNNFQVLDSGIVEKWSRGIFTIGADRSHRIEHTYIHHPDKYTCVCEMRKKYKMKKNKNKNKRIRETAEYEKEFRPILCPSHVSVYPWPTILFFTQMLLVKLFVS